MGDDNLLKFPVYKCGEINISTHDSVKITVESEPIVLWKDFVTVERDGELVGTIDGTFDFSDMPEEYHMTVLQIVQRGTRTLCLPSHKPAPPKPIPFHRAKKAW